MDLGISGKTALVAAASKGLGKAVALGLAKEGVKLAICARGEEELLKTAGELRSMTKAKVVSVTADVTDPDDIRKVVKAATAELGEIDILVTNAGGPPAGPFSSFNDKDWQNAMTLNLLSTVRLCRAVIPGMQRKGWGRIINLVSIAAKQPLEGLILSNAIRASVIGFAKTLSNELGNNNILVNNICPGWILTDRLVSVVQKRAESQGMPYENALRNITANIPLGRCGTAEEVANMIVFLASERSSYITGTTIQIDGGLAKGLF